MLEGSFKSKQEFEEYVGGIKLNWNNIADDTDWRFRGSNIIKEHISGTFHINTSIYPQNIVFLVLKYCMTGVPYCLKFLPTNKIQIEVFDDVINFAICIHGDDVLKACYRSAKEVVASKPHLFREMIARFEED